VLTIALIGSGNLGTQLFSLWKKHPSVQISQWVNRSTNQSIIAGVNCIPCISNLKPADAYILAVPDRSIPSVSAQLPPSGLAIHCSGSIPLTDLENNGSQAVLYPLQSFSKSQNINLSEIPLFLEVAEGVKPTVLQQIADSWSYKQYWIDSSQRQQLHLAAVFANNFTNQLYYMASQICQRNALPFEALLPLIQETAQKIQYLTPIQAQTGPAKRNDQEVLEKQQSLLADANEKKIYQLLSQAILNQEDE